MGHRKSNGMTLIELLVVVAIIGIIAAMAIPNFMDALDRARQKRTIGDIRVMVIAMQQFSVDFSGYPNTTYIGNIYETWPTINDAGGTPIIVPDYLQAVPAIDGWKVPYRYFSGPDRAEPVPELEGDQTVAGHYCVYSYGLDTMNGGPGIDGAAPATDVSAAYCADPSIAVGVKETYCYESDIVWGDSNFQQSPEGKQKKCG